MVGRPQKLNADYFTHDKDMRDDPKVKALRRKYGLEGYAIYVMMNEVLTDSDYFVHDFDELSIELLAGDFNIETSRLIEVLHYCNKLQLLTIEGDTIRNYTLEKRFTPLLSKRERDRDRIIVSENTQSKVKYSKEEESKGKESKEEELSGKPDYPDFAVELSKLILQNASIKKPTSKQIEAGADVIVKLETLDGYTPDEIQTVIRWALADSVPQSGGFCWAKNVQSGASLRNKKNGAGDVTKFAKIYNAWKRKPETEEERMERLRREI